MRIFLIDDEASARSSMERVVREARPEAEISVFSRGQAALDAIEQEGLRPDVVFSDIQMPGLSGLSLALRLRTVCPSAKVVFVTGYNEYAVEAYRLHAYGYVMKPLKPERVREELAHLEQLTAVAAKPETLCVRCFGHFEVFWQGKPLHFQRQQTKELFAYLISRDGAACTNGEIAAALWEEEADMKAMSARIRTLLHDLRGTLKQIGMEDVIIRHRASLAVNRDRIDCDYYRMQSGDVDAINAFHGAFMVQYARAEITPECWNFVIDPGIALQLPAKSGFIAAPVGNALIRFADERSVARQGAVARRFATERAPLHGKRVPYGFVRQIQIYAPQNNPTQDQTNASGRFFVARNADGLLFPRQIVTLLYASACMIGLLF